MDLLIQSAFIRPRKQTEREERVSKRGSRRDTEVEVHSSGRTALCFQAALHGITQKWVVIPPGSPLQPASFTMLLRLSSSTCVSRSMVLIKHHPGFGSGLRLGRGKKALLSNFILTLRSYREAAGQSDAGVGYRYAGSKF